MPGKSHESSSLSWCIFAVCRNLEDEVDSKSIAEKRASSNLVTAIYVHMAELADAHDLGSCAERRESSSLSMDIDNLPAELDSLPYFECEFRPACEIKYKTLNSQMTWSALDSALISSQLLLAAFYF